MKKKIDDFKGIEGLTEDLKKCRKLADQKEWFNNMIIYFNNLYIQSVDVENDAVEYRETSLETIEYLQKFNRARLNPTVDFLIDLIHYKLEYVSKLRKIN